MREFPTLLYLLNKGRFLSPFTMKYLVSLNRDSCVYQNFVDSRCEPEADNKVTKNSLRPHVRRHPQRVGSNNSDGTVVGNQTVSYTQSVNRHNLCLDCRSSCACHRDFATISQTEEDSLLHTSIPPVYSHHFINKCPICHHTIFKDSNTGTNSEHVTRLVAKVNFLCCTEITSTNTSGLLEVPSIATRSQGQLTTHPSCFWVILISKRSVYPISTVIVQIGQLAANIGITCGKCSTVLSRSAKDFTTRLNCFSNIQNISRIVSGGYYAIPYRVLLLNGCNSVTPRFSRSSGYFPNIGTHCNTHRYIRRRFGYSKTIGDCGHYNIINRIKRIFTFNGVSNILRCRTRVGNKGISLVVNVEGEHIPILHIIYFVSDLVNVSTTYDNRRWAATTITKQTSGDFINIRL